MMMAAILLLKQSTAFTHKDCFNRYGGSTGVVLPDGVQRISMVQAFFFPDKSLLNASAVVEEQLQIAIVGYDGENHVEPVLSRCAEVCAGVPGCEGIMLKSGAIGCQMYGGASFGTMLGGAHSSACNEYPMRVPCSIRSSTRDDVYLSTLCPASPIDPRKYRARLPKPAAPELPPVVWDLGAWVRIDFESAGATNPLLTTCQALLADGKAALAAVSPSWGASSSTIYCPAEGADVTFVWWLWANDGDETALAEMLDAETCDETGDTICAASTSALEAATNQFVMKLVELVDAKLSLTSTPPVTLFSGSTWAFEGYRTSLLTEYKQAFGADGSELGFPIAPGFRVTIWNNVQMVPESHQPPSAFRKSDLGDAAEDDLFPIPDGCFNDFTNDGTPSNPALDRHGAHYELKDKNGLDCLGGRSVEDMLRICLTICSLTDFGGPGTVDDRCVGVNYDEHGDKGHCHLQSSSMLLAADNPDCDGQTNEIKQGGLCMTEPRLTPRGICAELGSPDWCGLINYVAFFSFYNGDVGPHLGRSCGYGTGWDEAAQVCSTCPRKFYSLPQVETRIPAIENQPLDFPHVVNYCEECPPDRECITGFGCEYEADPDECPPKISCDAGYFWSVEAHTCVPCLEDTYQPLPGVATTCISCPAYSDTRKLIGNADSHDCQCQPGYVGTIISNTSVCHLCPPELGLQDCPGGELMIIPSGNFKFPTLTLELHRCDLDWCNETTTHSDGGTTCSGGATGPICGACLEGHALVGRQCVECGTADSATRLAVPVAILVIACVLVVVGCVCVQQRRQGTFDGRHDAKGRSTFGAGSAITDALKSLVGVLRTKTVILIGMVQLLKPLDKVFAIPFPDAFTGLLSFFSLFQLDVFDYMPIDCYLHSNFYGKLIVQTIWPFLALLLFAGIYVAMGVAGVGSSREIIKSISMFLIFLVYPSELAKVFAFFQCKQFEEVGTYMLADLRLDCLSEEHTLMTGYAALMVAVWPFGVPLFYIGLMWTDRKTLQQRRLKSQYNSRVDQVRVVVRSASASACRSATKATLKRQDTASSLEAQAQALRRNSRGLIESQEELRNSVSEVFDAELPRHLASLTENYKDEYYYFEAVQATHKLLLIGLCVFVDRGSNEQILVGLLVALFFALALARTMPYIDPLDNYLAIVCEAQVFFTLACAIVLNNNQNQQDNVTLENVMVVGLLIPLVVTVVLIAIQMRAIKREFFPTNTHLKKPRGREMQMAEAASPYDSIATSTPCGKRPPASRASIGIPFPLSLAAMSPASSPRTSRGDRNSHGDRDSRGTPIVHTLVPSSEHDPVEGQDEKPPSPLLLRKMHPPGSLSSV